MQKYIVPTKRGIAEWRSLFDEVFREEEHQVTLMHTLIGLIMFMSVSKNKKANEFVELFEVAMAKAVELADTGILPEENTDDAASFIYEFASQTAAYLKEIGVLQTPKTITFEGFVGMDIIIKILEEGEADDSGDKACLSG